MEMGDLCGMIKRNIQEDFKVGHCMAKAHYNTQTDRKFKGPGSKA
jgi:hypothetical protein